MTEAFRRSPQKRFSLDNALVAAWGEVRLEKISANAVEYADIRAPIEQQYGLLVSTAESFVVAKDDNRPVYRVIGGDGALLVVSKNKLNQIFVQRIIVAGATLAEKNFKSNLDNFIVNDRASPATDYSKWADVAYMARRLALNTTPESASKFVDEALSPPSSQKYRSRIWAYLPTSVITHLKNGTYHAIDVFSPDSEFPSIRENIIMQLNYNPTESFSEFLLYTIGRYDEAIRFNKNSPIKTILMYASGHAKLRECLSAVFSELAKEGDLNLLIDAIKPRSYIDDIDEEDLIAQFGSRNFKELNPKYHKVQIKIKEYDKKFEAKYREGSHAEKNLRLRQQNFFTDYAYESILTSSDDYRDGRPTVSQYLNYFNQFPERYNSRPIIQTLPSFGVLCDHTLNLMTEVTKNRDTPHFDDASYLLGWLEYHRGNVAEALSKFETAMSPFQVSIMQSNGVDAAKNDSFDSDREGGLSKDNKPEASAIDADGIEDVSVDASDRDYSGPAAHQTNRILRLLPPKDALVRVKNSKVLADNPTFWYEALSSLYRAHQYESLIEGARTALNLFGIAVESLPVTTNSDRIEEILIKLNLTDYNSLADIIYLYQSAREAQNLEAALASANPKSANSLSMQVKSIIAKYARVQDDVEDKPARPGPTTIHRDLRQGLYIANRALDLLPKDETFSKTREWIYYKRATLLTEFNPIKVAAANSEFYAEFPSSPLLDDAAAEQLFAEAVVMRDMTKANVTFNMMRQRFPKTNAIDNAYSWMAIGWTCAGQPEKAREIDKEIIRRFALTRHARFARDRLRKSSACAELLYLYNWDYRAMTWRERNRIDNIQADFKVLQR